MNFDACPYNLCHGSGSIRIKDGSSRHCKCKFRHAADERFRKSVGKHDQHISLKTLQPSNLSRLPFDLQERCISVMKGSPADSYFMAGQSGCSKTTYTVALFRYALDAWVENWENSSTLYCPIVRIKAKTLLEKITAFAISGNESDRPPIMANWIRAAAKSGSIYRLFLEELEKVKYSEFKMTELWDIIDALYEEGGQLVVSGNLKMEDLEDTTRFMEGFPRRIREICQHNWNFWQYETVNA